MDFSLLLFHVYFGDIQTNYYQSADPSIVKLGSTMAKYLKYTALSLNLGSRISRAVYLHSLLLLSEMLVILQLHISYDLEINL